MIVISNKYSLYDTTDERKIHTGNISRLGGVGILFGFAFGIIYFSLNGLFAQTTQNILFLIPAAFLIVIMGVIDDLKNLNAKIKLLTQILAAILVILGGYKIPDFKLANFSINFGIFTYPITFCWILGITNAINLIDGLDGLSGGLSFISAITFAFFGYLNNNLPCTYISLVLAFAILGFLVYNLPLPKAKIFMGDGGSQFLGFILSLLPLITPNNTVTISLVHAIAILMIPIFDTLAAIWRRLREHRRIDSPDKFHMHHKLLLIGFSKRKTLFLVLILQVIVSILCILSLRLGQYTSLVLLFTVYLIGVFFFTLIHIGKTKALKKNENC